MSLPLHLILIPILPLVSFLLLGIFGRKYFPTVGGVIGTTLMFISCVFAIETAFNYFFVSGNIENVYRTLIPFQMTWLPFSADVSINVGMMLDPISVMMLVVVTVVSLMVHIYSLGYMQGEERFSTYYAFLGLFTFSMLGLVVSVNIFQIYMFWELVGVSSFLLIGYYFEKPSAVAASKKAFIVTRFADLGFLIGILVLSFQAHTLDFRTLITRLTDVNSPYLHSASTASFLGASALTWGLLLVFIGGAGKSAMFPLHIWLPDAMEGPTPVSALIHAATMVVAGVFLVARLFPIFVISCPAALNVVMWVGAISAMFAAIIACTQTDIKRVLAYSTMSQIGYMMFALGVSGYGGENQLGFTASMFHLFTHAFFKALLFLGAGAVIHMIHSNEMKDMGGLRKKMPITHLSFLIACLAIAGIPPFAGFFSKEEILAAAFHAQKTVFVMALLTAGITAFYMFRLYFSIFWSRQDLMDLHDSNDDASHAGHAVGSYASHDDASRAGHAVGSHANHNLGHPENHSNHVEGTWSMKIPMLILTLGAVFAGFVPFGKFVSADGTALHAHEEWTFSIAPVLVAAAGILFAMRMYKTKNDGPDKLAASLSGLYTSASNRFYIDEVYTFVTKKIIFNMIGRPAAWIDKNIVDGSMNGLASLVAWKANFIRVVQSGKVQDYALYFFIGLFGLVALAMYVIN